MTSTSTSNSPNATSAGLSSSTLPRDENSRPQLLPGFNGSRDFMLFALKEANQFFSGGLTKDELKSIITKWNETNPDKTVRFIEGPFRSLAARAGHPDTIDSATFYSQLGLTSEDRSWTRNKDFLRFVYQSARQALTDGGLTRQELSNVINIWNEMNKEKPLSKVVNNSGDYERFAQKDASQTAYGSQTISIASIAQALGVRVSGVENKDFIEFALTKGAHLTAGGYTLSELQRVIAYWNQLNPTKPVALTNQEFKKLAATDGRTETVNSNELLNSIGLSRIHRMWGNNQAFIKFLDTDPEAKRRSSDGLTRSDITALVDRWNNIICRNNPLNRVIADRFAFERLARKDDNFQHISRDEIAAVLGRNHLLDQGKLENFRGIWDRLSLPFTYDSLIDSINKGLSQVLCINNRGINLHDAFALVFNKTGVTNFRSTLTQEQVEQAEIDSYNPFKEQETALKQRQQAANRYRAAENRYLQGVKQSLGRDLTPQEQQNYRLAYSYDVATQQVIKSLGQAYANLTGITRQDAPFAYAALDFLGSIPASIFVAGKQIDLARSDLITYLSTATRHAPETFTALLQSLNVFEAGIPGEERFSRTLNAITIIIGALKFGPKTNSATRLQAAQCKFPSTEAEFFSAVNETLKGRDFPPHLKTFLENQGYKLSSNIPEGNLERTVVNIFRENLPSSLLEQYRSLPQNMVAKELRFLIETEIPQLRLLDRTISRHQRSADLHKSFTTLKEVLAETSDETSFKRLINDDVIRTGNNRSWEAHDVTIGGQKFVSICPLGRTGNAPRIYIRFERDPSGNGSRIAEIRWDPEHNQT